MAYGGRGGFGMGGMNMQAMMKQAQKLQEQVRQAQEELQNTEVEGTAGGMVTVISLHFGKRFFIVPKNISRFSSYSSGE